MSNAFTATVSKFRFQGTKFTAKLRDSIRELNDLALLEMLQYMASNTPNFTGETQATFRQFRDFLQKDFGFSLELNDFTQPFVLKRQSSFRKAWNIPAKIANLSNAGFATADGKRTVFNVDITKQGFKIKVVFASGSEAFENNPELQSVFEEAKAVYKKSFVDSLDLLFSQKEFAGMLKSYFNRVTVRSR